MVFFSYLRVLIYLPFLAVLTGSGGGCPRLSLIHINPSRHLHLCIRLPLPLPNNISPHHALISLPLHLQRSIFSPHATIYIYLPLPLLQHLITPHETLSLTLSLTYHLIHPCAPLSISLLLRLPHPPCLSQSLPCCHSYPNIAKQFNESSSSPFVTSSSFPLFTVTILAIHYIISLLL